MTKTNLTSITIESKKRKLFKSERRKEQKILLIAVAVIVLILVYIVVGIATSLKIKTSTYVIEYGNLPVNFDGYKIVQITDYHKGVYGNENKALVDGIRALEPDIIVMTGDIIDKSSDDIENITDLCQSLCGIAPVLWIRGNHFYKADEALAEELEGVLEEMGVISLVNECYIVSRDGQNIKFCGVDDPENLYSGEDLPSEYVKSASYSAMERFLAETEENSNGEDGFKILLSHRYSVYEKFPEYGYSLAFAGHSHGGQLKLPGGIDIIGYNLKLFPKVKSGYNDIDGMPLIVSSGLGTSNLNLRLYNPPEIVLVELKSK
jgi:predicted MPP superfamily phosphohydrolase